jgi:hypothetical protein
MTAVEAGNQPNAYVIHEFERRAYALSDIPVRIGRDGANDVVLRESAVSRFNTEVRRENGQSVLYSPGSTPTLLNGLPIVDQAFLTEGAKIEVGSAVLTYTEKRLPIGVAIVERAKKRDGTRDDVLNRRDTIKHPLIKGSTAEQPPDPLLRAKVLAIVLVVLAVLYFFGR